MVKIISSEETTLTKFSPIKCTLLQLIVAATNIEQNLEKNPTNFSSSHSHPLLPFLKLHYLHESSTNFSLLTAWWPPSFSYFYNLFTLTFKFTNMVLTRSQLEKMGRDNVIEQLLNVNLSDVSAKLCDLIEFVSKYAKLHLELQLTL